MKKLIGLIKKNWRENRVLFVLSSILIVCLILILFVVMDYFLGTKKDKYGDRLENIQKNAITVKEEKEIIKSIEESDKVEKATIKIVGRVIYINIKFNDSLGLNEAQAITLSSVEKFSEKQLKYYDLNYTIKQDKSGDNEGFLMMGAKNINGTDLVWINNTPIEEDGE